MNKQSRNRVRKDSPRIIGTYSERIRLLQLTQRVWELLPQLHPELNFDHEAFAHITVGFLREKRRSPSRLMGLCSLSNPKRGNAVKHSERHGIHRILIQRRLVFEDPYECIRTIHHEFVHAMLKDFENPHGDRFWEHEGRIVTHIHLDSCFNEIQYSVWPFIESPMTRATHAINNGRKIGLDEPTNV